MFDQQTWKVLHLVGIALLLMSLGGFSVNALIGGTKDSLKGKGWMLLLVSFKLGLLLSVLAGFGMVHAHDSLLPESAADQAWMKQGWVHAKATLWLLIGVAGMLLLRKPGLAKALWFALPVLLGIAAWLAGVKPF